MRKGLDSREITGERLLFHPGYCTLNSKRRRSGRTREGASIGSVSGWTKSHATS